MASIAATGSLVSLNTVLSNSTAPLLPAITSALPPHPSNSQNPISTPILFTVLALAFGILLHLFTGSRGGGGNSGRRGGGPGGGKLCSKFYAWVTNAKEEETQFWDPHGLSTNVLVKLNELSWFKNYKVSEVILFDENTNGSISSDDPVNQIVNEIFSLRQGGIYTKSQLKKKLESLSTCGMFEKVDIESSTNPDGTIGIKLSFVENTWEISDSFRCINVGLLPGNKGTGIREDMARSCLLPASVHKEVLNLLGEGKVSARMLEKIHRKVDKWYQDNGYVCAQVLNFGNLDTREIVCEVVEGDITRVVLQFQDKNGNVCDRNTQFGVVNRELLAHFGQGKPFNIEEAKLALHKINSLGLFSTIEVVPRPDGKNGGGIVVEIILKELDQQSAEVLE